MIVPLSTLLSRHCDQSNCWCLTPLQSLMRFIHINWLFAVVAQFCALVAINCCCHCRSFLRLKVGHEYRVNNVVVLRLSFASLMQNKSVALIAVGEAACGSKADCQGLPHLV